MDDEVGYYQLLDNYTIWRLETVKESSPSHRAVRALSLPSHPSPSHDRQNLVHTPFDIPLHKKRNLAKNLRAMMGELQQKVDKIEAEISEDDFVTTLIPQQKTPQKEEDHRIQSHCPSTICSHLNELTRAKQQIEFLSRSKNSLEDQIVKLQLDKSANQDTDSEKRVSKLERENKLLKEQVKISLEKLGQLNTEKYHDVWNRFGKGSLLSEPTHRPQFESQIRKIKITTGDLKNDLESIKGAFQVFKDSIGFQLYQCETGLKRLREQKRHRHPEFPNGATNKPPSKEPESIFPRRKTVRKDSFQHSTENDSDIVLECSPMNLESFIQDKRPQSGHRGNGVIYKIRPILEKGIKSSINVSNDTIQIQHKNRTKIFQCDQIVQSQEQLFELLKPTIMSCLEEVNACIFLYGETGSGKTFTAEGSVEREGILSFCIKELLQELNARNQSATLSCSVAELRNETFRDVLSSDSTYLETKQTSDGSIVLQNWKQCVIASADHYNKILLRCHEVHKAHNCNMSHLIHTLNITLPNVLSPVRLCIIDLAGSERMDKPSQDPMKIKEIQNVTKSLTCLGDVLHAVNSRMCHVPYRSSKLTHFLQDYMKNRNRCQLIVHLKKDEKCSSESISSLMFGQRTIGSDVSQQGTRTPTKPASRGEGNTPAARPRRPSTGLTNLPGLAESRNFARRSSISSERQSSKKFSMTPRTEGMY